MPLGAREPSRPSSSSRMKTTRSSWTPLNHPLTNSKVFEERRNLLAKWFDRWSDGQRKAVLQDLVLSCAAEQLRFLSLSVSRRLPLQAADFSSLLPRALCLHLFSFLDPRSLCRCARVSWRWRSIVELDQLWMPKCVRLGWYLGFSPGPLEQGVWKRHYIQSVQELRLTSLQQSAAPHVSFVSNRREDPSGPASIREEPSASTTRPPGSISRTGLRKEKPPWRDSDRRPRDTRRFNYLDNMDAGAAALRAPVSSSTSSSSSWRPDDGSQRTPSEARYKLRRAKSLMFLSSNWRPQPPNPPPPAPPPPPPPPPPETQSRPPWASRSPDPPVTRETAKVLLRLTRWNAGIRPGPVRSSAPRLSVEALRASRRSQRSAPSKQSQLLHLLWAEHDVTTQQEAAFRSNYGIETTDSARKSQTECSSWPE